MRSCAPSTCTDTPPCGGGYGPTKSTFINKSPAPQFEGDESPELQVHGAASIVHFDQSLEIWLSENTSVDAGFRQEEIAHERPELSTEPVAQRNRKTALRPIQSVVRQNAFHRLLKNVFRRDAHQLEFRRYGCGKLDKFVVQEGHASFDRMCHAHPIDFCQNVVG